MSSARLVADQKFKLYNKPDANLITNEAAVEFIEAIYHEQRAGYGFVPFIGAGFSAPSGVPLLVEIKSYLERCIGLALGVESNDMRPWNPRTDAWPPMYDRKPPEGKAHVQKPVRWLDLVENEFHRKKEKNEWDPEAAVFLEAMGAMAEWRTALLFLSRIVWEVRGDSSDRTRIVLLDAPSQEVLDAGLKEIVRGKSPSLGHRMLANLAGLLRPHIIVSTNFDDLLEQAYFEARNPLSISDLEMINHFPSVASLTSQPALIKIHGGARSLRADYSLDALPSHEDRWHFLEYLLAPKSRQDLLDALASGKSFSRLEHKNHLLVMGFSAAERRTRALVLHAVAHLADGFKVFWLCHTPADVIRVKELSSSFGLDEESNGKPGPVSHILRYPDQGLLLLQLFQALRGGIPAHGVIFPTASRMPTPPLASPPIGLESAKTEDRPAAGAAPTPEHVKSAQTQLSVVITNEDDITESGQEKAVNPAKAVHSADAITQIKAELATESLRKFRLDIVNEVKKVQGNPTVTNNIIVVGAPTKISGATSACARAFEDLEKDNLCFWFDMNDISKPSDLFEKVLDAAYFRLGQEHWMPVSLTDKPGKRIEELLRLAERGPKPWVMFLNARETPAANSISPEDVTSEDYPNTWLDGMDMVIVNEDNLHPDFSEADREMEKEDRMTWFVEMLESITISNRTPITVVLLCRYGDKVDPITSDYAAPPVVRKLREENVLVSNPLVLRTGKEYDEDGTLHELKKWALGETSDSQEAINTRLHFLHILCLMQRPRYLATVWGTGLFPADPMPEQDRQIWLRKLEDIGLVRRKAGGFVWLHTRLRTRLRTELKDWNRHKDAGANPAEPAKDDPRHVDGIVRHYKKGYREAEIHARLASWYRGVLISTQSPAALFEAVYHSSLSALRTIEHAVNEGDPKLLENHSESQKTPFLGAAEQLNWAAVQLRTFLFLAQTQGFSRESCRILTYIRDEHCRLIDNAVEKLDKLLGVDEIKTNSIREANRRLKRRCTEAMRGIAREVGEITKAYKRHRQMVHFLTDDPIPASVSRSKHLENELLQKLKGEQKKRELLTELRIEPRNWELLHRLIEEQNTKSLGDADVEWLRWWRWGLMLAIESRSYVEAEKSILRGLSSLVTTPDKPIPNMGEIINNHQVELIAPVLTMFGIETNSGAKLRLELARLLEQTVEYLLLCLNLDDRCEHERELAKAIKAKVIEGDNKATKAEEIFGPDSDPAVKWETIRTVCRIANFNVERAMGQDRGLSSSHHQAAMWCKGRVRMHQSIIEVMQAKESPERDRWETAMGFLSTADAFMTETGHDRNDSDLAVIDLLRADVRLREAEGTVIRNDSAVTLSEVKLRVYEMFGKRPELSQCYPDISESRERRAGEEVYKLFDGCDQMRRARALVEDSIQYLDRAERSLRQRRRNVWWTTWLFDRRLRAIALSIWTSVTEPGSSIPYLGLDSTPRLRDTLADTLLDDTIRMVRLDMYRLATAVEAYADCAFALKVRLLCDAGSNWNHPRLPSRQEAMMRRIEFATKTMAEVRRDRIMVGHESSREPGKRRKRGAPSNNDLLDPRVKYYFDQVGANVAQICGFLDGSYYANSAIAQAMDVPDVEEDSD